MEVRGKSRWKQIKDNAYQAGQNPTRRPAARLRTCPEKVLMEFLKLSTVLLPVSCSSLVKVNMGCVTQPSFNFFPMQTLLQLLNPPIFHTCSCDESWSINVRLNLSGPGFLQLPRCWCWQRDKGFDKVWSLLTGNLKWLIVLWHKQSRQRPGPLRAKEIWKKLGFCLV